MTQRITWIDLAKGITVFFVVFGHVIIGLFDAKLYIGSTQAHLLTAVQAVYLFHMPVFFALSGYFFKPANSWADVGTLLKKRSISLGIPYIVFCALLLALFAIGGDALRDPVNWTAIFYIWQVPVGPSWFLYVLFIVMITSSLLSLVIKDIRLHFVVSLVLFAVGNLWPSSIYALQAFMVWSPFFLFGAFLRRYPIKPRWYLLVGAISIYSAYLVYWTSTNPTTRVRYAAPGFEILLMLLAIVIAFMLFPLINSNTRFGHYFDRMGQQSLGIYMLHIPLVSATRMCLLHLGTTNIVTHIILGTLVGWYGSTLILKYVHPLQYVLHPLNYINSKKKVS